MSEIDGVDGVHDFHVWTVTSGFVALSAHVETRGERDWNHVLPELTTMLADRFGIDHVTLQPKLGDGRGSAARGFSFDLDEGRSVCLSLTAAHGPSQLGGHRVRD